MRTCPVCGHENDDLAVLCVSCKGFVQGKVDALDLFHTLWDLMERPRATMHRIAIARHKNYMFLLASLFGIAVLYAAAWYYHLGPRLGGFAPVVVGGVLAGPLVGILLLVTMAFLLKLVARLLGGRSEMRATMAVVAYSASPIVFTLVFVFPAELAVFGEYLFDNNPPLMVINPVAYVGLLGLDVIGAVWSFWLLTLATRTALRLPAVRGVLASFSVPAAVAGVMLLLGRLHW